MWRLIMNKKDVAEKFFMNPSQFVDELIKKKMLKGYIREYLKQIIFDNMNLPWISEYVWVALMPSIISIVCVKGKCNLSCRMCGGSKGKLQYLSARNLKKILRNIPTAELVIFVAGDSEPLLSPEWHGILKVIKEFGLNSNIVTNGHLLSKELISTMIKYGQPSVLNISIDSPVESTYRKIRGGDLNKLLEKLTLFRDIKAEHGSVSPELSLLMVGMEDNISELSQLVELAHNLKASRVHIDHLNGDLDPGDFVLNKKWKSFVLKAVQVAADKNVSLQLPHDITNLLRQSATFKSSNWQRDSKSKSNYIKSKKDVKVINEDVEKTDSCRPSSVIQCPWLYSIYIQLDGVLWPCCSTSYQIGNIYDGPLQQNMTYLKARMENLKGKLFKPCMSTNNCAYVQELKINKLTPAFFP